MLEVVFLCVMIMFRGWRKTDDLPATGKLDPVAENKEVTQENIETMQKFYD